MPGKACLKLKGKARADCLAYKGKYAKKTKSDAVSPDHEGYKSLVRKVLDEKCVFFLHIPKIWYSK